jgi:Ca-activated chloride channel homolog
VAARGSFELNALLSGEPVAAGMITYRVPGEDGFFMLWLAPPIQEEDAVAKDVILVLDVSGSMAGQKIVQAKAALRFVLNRLNPEDRFNVIAFSSSVDRYAASMRPVSEAGAAISYVDRLRAEGGTNINDALITALRGADPERFTTVLFLTDGEPTAGERTPSRIMDNVRDAMPGNARLFVFGVGHDVNTVLLDGLATQNRGDVAYVRPEEDVEDAVSTLYSRISAPQLTGVQLDMGDALTYDLYPQPLPDLFSGQTLFVLGRYRSSGAVNVRLSGSTRAGPQTHTFDAMQMPEADRGASYLPRLWASRKVGYLLREIRLRGANASSELIDEVVALSTRYGIVTPYTSYLVQEAPVSPQAAARAVATAAAAPVSGAGATGASAQTGFLAGATPAPARTPTPAATSARPPATAPGQTQPAPSAPAAITYVADKTFVQRAGVWTDTAYQPGSDTQKVSFASDEYFALLAQKPELAPFFALGTRVIVVLEGVAYEVTE